MSCATRRTHPTHPGQCATGQDGPRSAPMRRHGCRGVDGRTIWTARTERIDRNAYRAPRVPETDLLADPCSRHRLRERADRKRIVSRSLFFVKEGRRDRSSRILISRFLQNSSSSRAGAGAGPVGRNAGCAKRDLGIDARALAEPAHGHTLGFWTDGDLRPALRRSKIGQDGAGQTGRGLSRRDAPPPHAESGECRSSVAARRRDRQQRIGRAGRKPPITLWSSLRRRRRRQWCQRDRAGVGSGRGRGGGDWGRSGRG